MLCRALKTDKRELELDIHTGHVNTVLAQLHLDATHNTDYIWCNKTEVGHVGEMEIACSVTPDEISGMLYPTYDSKYDYKGSTVAQAKCALIQSVTIVNTSVEDGYHKLVIYVKLRDPCCKEMCFAHLDVSSGTVLQGGSCVLNMSNPMLCTTVLEPVESCFKVTIAASQKQIYADGMLFKEGTFATVCPSTFVGVGPRVLKQFLRTLETFNSFKVPWIGAVLDTIGSGVSGLRN
uniref:Uncharacterized protein n=1 Tax=Romanomermis culicivorax TaxID=13658 RepID=A0A915K1F3_ROMCU